MVAIKDEFNPDAYTKLLESLVDSLTLKVADSELCNYNLKQKSKIREEKIRVLEEEIISGP